MGLADQAPQSTDQQVASGQTNLTLGQRANELLRDAQTDEAGKLILPEDIPSELKELVMTEKKFRDTQSAYTKGQQEIAALRAEKEALLAQVANPVLSVEDSQRLVDLKYSDPDKWFVEKQRLEAIYDSYLECCCFLQIYLPCGRRHGLFVSEFQLF